MSLNENPMNFRYGSEREIDLTELLTTLLNGWKIIMTVVLMFVLAGGGVALLLPQKWTSRAVITPADAIQWQVMDRMTASLNALGVGETVSREEAFVLFIKKFQSRSLLEAYLATSPYVITGRKGTDTDPGHNYQQVVNIAQEMKAVDSAADKKTDKSPYSSWTLAFTARTPGDAQAVLGGVHQPGFRKRQFRHHKDYPRAGLPENTD